MAAVELTPQSILDMRNNTAARGQIVQVIDVMLMQAFVGGQGRYDRYRIIISDGTYFQPGMVFTGTVSTQLHELVQGMQTNAIVRLDNWTLNTVGGRTMIIVLALTILHSDYGMRMGAPQSIEQLATPPAAMVAVELTPQRIADLRSPSIVAVCCLCAGSFEVKVPPTMLRVPPNMLRTGAASLVGNCRFLPFAAQCCFCNSSFSAKYRSAPTMQSAERAAGQGERMQAAEQGDVMAQVHLAACFAMGADGLEKSWPNALRLYFMAARQDSASAQCSLGVFNLQGAGMAHDLAVATQYFHLAAEQGFASAQYWLGYLSECGKGVKRDMAEAVRMYRAAAAQGDVRALARLGVCLEKGRGVAQGEVEAAVCYAAASELGGAATLFISGVRHLDEIGERSAPDSLTLQLAVRDLVLAGRLGHTGAVEKLASVARRRDVASVCCLGCGATRALKLCDKCRVAKFCDRECQTRLWTTHGRCCRQWRQEDAGEGADQ
jgi:hypothetical protein